jgi:starch synthase
LAKAGGLADVVGALPRFTHRVESGVDASVLLPAYDWLKDSIGEVACESSVRVGADQLAFRVRRVREGVLDFEAYLVEHACFAGATVYPGGADLQRAAVLGAGALALCRALADGAGPRVDVLHAHDHHSAIATIGLESFPKPPPLVVTVHNARYHGALDWSEADQLDLPKDLDRARCDHEGRFNRLKAAILSAQVVTTVSPTHARDLVERAESSHGLDYAFRLAGSRFIGILNGIDIETWDPATDPMLEAHFSRDDLQGKAEQKRALCSELGFQPAKPLLAFVGRLVPEKGVDALLHGAHELITRDPDVQVAVLGTGEPRYEDALRWMAGERPSHLCVVTRHDEAMAHRMYAGADALLMPSWHEPCGLSQMYAMRYGTIPVVFPTGGLRDSVVPFDATTRRGTGAWMERADGPALADAASQVLAWRREPATWDALMSNAMSVDLSWTTSARRYVDAYRRALEAR